MSDQNPTPAPACDQCKGTGLFGYVHGQHMPCPACNGTGQAAEDSTAQPVASTAGQLSKSEPKLESTEPTVAELYDLITRLIEVNQTMLKRIERIEEWIDHE